MPTAYSKGDRLCPHLHLRPVSIAISSLRRLAACHPDLPPSKSRNRNASRLMRGTIPGRGRITQSPAVSEYGTRVTTLTVLECTNCLRGMIAAVSVSFGNSARVCSCRPRRYFSNAKRRRTMLEETDGLQFTAYGLPRLRSCAACLAAFGRGLRIGILDSHLRRILLWAPLSLSAQHEIVPRRAGQGEVMGWSSALHRTRTGPPVCAHPQRRAGKRS